MLYLRRRLMMIPLKKMGRQIDPENKGWLINEDYQRLVNGDVIDFYQITLSRKRVGSYMYIMKRMHTIHNTMDNFAKDDAVWMNNLIKWHKDGCKKPFHYKVLFDGSRIIVYEYPLSP